MISYHEEEWRRSANGGYVQQAVKVYVGQAYMGRFLIRRYSDYHWMSIGLGLKSLGVCTVLREGQSDTDCRRKTKEVIEEKYCG